MITIDVCMETVFEDVPFLERPARIAEAVYPRVTGLYDFEPPERTHLILADYEDYANGAAYFFDGKFEIWATNEIAKKVNADDFNKFRQETQSAPVHRQPWQKTTG